MTRNQRFGPDWQASAHRRRLASRIRALSAGVAGGTLAVTLALGLEFAQALPGHAPAAAPHRPARTGSLVSPRRPRPGRAQHRPARHRGGLARPSRPPASTPSPPQVSSGGS
jgi:hypothetical protein